MNYYFYLFLTFYTDGDITTVVLILVDNRGREQTHRAVSERNRTTVVDAHTSVVVARGARTRVCVRAVCVLSLLRESERDVFSRCASR